MFHHYADPQVRKGEAETFSESPWVRFGPGVLHEVGNVAERLGIHKALLIIDPHLAHHAAVPVMGTRLAEHNVGSVQAMDITPTPRYADVAACLERLRAEGCDGVISFGGGSAHDVGKAVALIGKHGGTISEYAHGHKVVDDTLAHIAIPTTAGTGAEISSYAFLLEDHGHEHTILHHPILVPEAALIDPLAHMSMPKNVTAATGMNALSDAIEAYVSRSHTPAADAAAMQAIHLIGEHLVRAYEHPEDLDARKGMARAAYLAGVAFNEAGLGIVDSISLILSEMFTIGHSTANAIVLPHVMAYDAFSVEDRLGDVARALGRRVTGLDQQGQAQQAIDAVQDLKAAIGLDLSLADRGMTWDDLYLCAAQILHHPFIKRNPRPLDRSGLSDILLDAMETKRIVVAAPPERA